MSRQTPSITIPSPPRACTRRVKISPTTAASRHPRASITMTSPGSIDSRALRWGELSRSAYCAFTRSSRFWINRTVRARPTMRPPSGGASGFIPVAYAKSNPSLPRAAVTVGVASSARASRVAWSTDASLEPAKSAMRGKSRSRTSLIVRVRRPKRTNRGERQSRASSSRGA